MLFSGWRIDQKIIQVQKAGPTSEITQCYLHQPLETSWLVPHFEGITFELGKAKGTGEHCFVNAWTPPG